LAYPPPGASRGPLTRILLGMHDYASGLDLDRLSVTADFPVDGLKPGENLATRFQALPGNRWELRLQKPVAALPKGRLTVSVQDRQGNRTQIERTLSVMP
jgi:hypothetical protein